MLKSASHWNQISAGFSNLTEIRVLINNRQ